MRKTWLVILGILLALVLVAGCAAPEADPPVDIEEPAEEEEPTEDPPEDPAEDDRILVVGWPNEPDTIDLHTSGAARDFRLLHGIHETWTWATTDGRILPGLARDWDVSDDGLTYTFYMREGVKFHDGTPVNAEAAKFTWDRLVDPDTGALSALGFLGNYESSEVVDEYTVKVHMSAPFAPFLRNLSSPGLAPISPTAVAEQGDDQFTRTPVGAGPFMVEEWVEGSHLLLVRNPDYDWASEFHDHSGPARLAGIQFNWVPEDQVRYSALLTGELDVVEDVPLFHLEDLEENPDFVVLKEPTPGISVHCWLNTKKSPTDDLRVRQALNYAYNFDGLNRSVFNNELLPPGGPLTRTMWGFTEEFSDTYEEDPARAEELLDEAGWVMGDDGYRYKDGERLELDYSVQSPSYVEDVAEYIQGNFADFGIHVNLNVKSSSAWQSTNFEGTHNLTTGGVWRTDPDLLRLAFSAEHGIFTWSFWENSEFDDLIMASQAAVDEDERLEIVAELQSMITRHAVTLPLFDQVTRFAHAANVEGLVFEENMAVVYYGARFTD